jgi:acyl transferase domain-containing protein
VHVVLSDGPRPPRRRGPVERAPGFLLPLSARSPEAAQELARAYVDRLASAHTHDDLVDICYSAGARRSHGNHRAYALGADRDALVGQLEALAGGSHLPATSGAGRRKTPARPSVVYVFPCDGVRASGCAQGLRMLVELGYGATARQCDRAVREETGASVLDLMLDEGCGATTDKATRAALWMLQVELASRWRSWGVEPDLVMGVGSGEAAAATVAGALTPSEAAAVVCRSASVPATPDAFRTAALMVELADVSPTGCSTPMHSTTLGRLVDGTELKAGYWTDSPHPAMGLTAAMRAALRDDRPTVFVEMSPHPVVGGDGLDVLPGSVVLPGVCEQPDPLALLRSLGQAYVAGCSPRWDRVYPHARYVSVPTYPWQRRQYWIAGERLRGEAVTGDADTATAASGAGGTKACVPAKSITEPRVLSPRRGRGPVTENRAGSRS